jgi:hypothetical protein
MTYLDIHENDIEFLRPTFNRLKAYSTIYGYIHTVSFFSQAGLKQMPI